MASWKSMASLSSGCTILVVRNGLEPLGRQREIDGEVRHHRVGTGSMPVFFVGLDADGVAGGNGARGLAPFLHQPAALLDEQQLRRGMAVPVGAASGLELDQVDNHGLAGV